MYRVIESGDDQFELTGPVDFVVGLINAFLKYLAARSFPATTIRAYSYDLKNYCDWLEESNKNIVEIKAPDILEYINWQRRAANPQRKLENVYSLQDGRAGGYSINTINRRLATVSSFYRYVLNFEKADMKHPMPVSGAKKALKAHSINKGLLAHLQKGEVKRNNLYLKRPVTLPQSLPPQEVETLIGSLRCYRDKAMALLMLMAGLRSSEVLALGIEDVNIEDRSIKVNGKGAKQRVVPVDPVVTWIIQRYVVFERPNIHSKILFQVLKGPHTGQPLTKQGLRTIFRYHRQITGLLHANPHKLRHTFGTNLADAGMDVQVIQKLMGHDHLDSSLAYIHTSPEKVREEYDKAIGRIKNMMGSDGL